MVIRMIFWIVILVFSGILFIQKNKSDSKRDRIVKIIIKGQIVVFSLFMVLLCFLEYLNIIPL